jgi:hypothetical protein
MPNKEKGRNSGGSIAPGVGANYRAVWTPYELNDQYKIIRSLLDEYNNDYIIHHSRLEESNWRAPFSKETYQPITDEEYDNLAKSSLSLVNSQLYLFHGNSNSETRKLILETGELRSRVVQERLTSKSYFNTGQIKHPTQEAEQVCFSEGLLSYAIDTAGGIFTVAVPEASIYRTSGFFYSDGLHAFDSDLHEGFHMDIMSTGGVVIMDEDVSRRLSSVDNVRYMQELKEKWGDQLSTDISLIQNRGKSIKKEVTPIAKQARIVPTGILMDTAASIRDSMVYKVNWE